MKAEKKMLVTATVSLFVVSAGVAAEDAPYRMLDDGGGEIQWSCPQAPVEKFTDAAAGKKGVAVEVKEPMDVELHWDGD